MTNIVSLGPSYRKLLKAPLNISRGEVEVECTFFPALKVLAPSDDICGDVTLNWPCLLLSRADLGAGTEFEG